MMSATFLFPRAYIAREAKSKHTRQRARNTLLCIHGCFAKINLPAARNNEQKSWATARNEQVKNAPTSPPENVYFTHLAENKSEEP